MGGLKSEDEARMQKYISLMRPLFKKRAVFSDETRFYRKPFEPMPGDNVTIRIRTASNNVDNVYFISGAARRHLHFAETRGSFDYFELTIPVGTEPVYYYFEIKVGTLTCYYNKLGITRDLSERHSFRIFPGFRTPAWARGAVMYQIYPDRFCNGDRSNGVLTDEYAYLNGHSARSATGTVCPKPWMSGISGEATSKASSRSWITCRNWAWK